MRLDTQGDVLLQPDWDMFHSKHPAALLHASARVVSGSGIYVSDKPDAHDFDLLQRLVLPDSSILRPKLAGRPTKDILFADVLKDNKTLLKVGTQLLPLAAALAQQQLRCGRWLRHPSACVTT